jgi:hypothetical protein
LGLNQPKLRFDRLAETFLVDLVAVSKRASEVICLVDHVELESFLLRNRIKFAVTKTTHLTAETLAVLVERVQSAVTPKLVTGLHVHQCGWPVFRFMSTLEIIGGADRENAFDLVVPQGLLLRSSEA